MVKQNLKRIVSDSEYRLRLLFALQQLGLCHQEELWPFLAELELMDYMPFCQYLSDLIDSGEIGRLPDGNEYVTAKGRESLKLFASRIPASLRTKTTKKAPLYKKRLSEHKQVKAGFELTDEQGRGHAYGFYYEESIPILLIKMNTLREGLCEKFVNGFAQKLPVILPLLNSISIVPHSDCAINSQAIKMAEKGHPMVNEINEHEFGAVVCLQNEDTEYRIQLLFHSMDSACGWAVGADACGDRLALQFTTVFEAMP